MVKKDMLDGMRRSLCFARRCVTVALLVSSVIAVRAQQPRTVQVCVKDQSGSAIADAKMQVVGAKAEALSDSGGCASLQVSLGGTVQITRDGFASVTQTVGAAAELTVVMQPGQVSEVV